MIKKVKIFEDLPIEEGKTYKTRFATGDLFLVQKVKKIKFYGNIPDKVISFEGLYVGREDIGVCPLAIDRLIPEKKLIGSKIVSDDSEFDLTDLLKKAFEAGQLDKGNNWYGGNVEQYLNTIE